MSGDALPSSFCRPDRWSPQAPLRGFRRWLWTLRILLIGIPMALAAQEQSGSLGSATTRDQLRLLDGGSLQGRLVSMEPERGLAWQHPDAAEPMVFAPANLAWINLGEVSSEPDQSQASATSRLRFHNGDEVFGDLIRLDTNSVELRTWTGENLKCPRSSIRSLVRFPKGYQVKYEGPGSTNGWQQPPPGRAWALEAGALTAKGIGLIGRDLGIKQSSSIEFDLAWTGQFNMMMAIYSEVSDRLEYIYNRSSYLFFLSPGFVTLQRVQAGTGTTQLGYVQVTQMLQRNPVHLEVRTSREDATITLLVNGTIAQRWKDGGGFVGQGSGLVLYNQMDAAPIRIHNLRATEWDVRLDLEPGEDVGRTNDLVRLANRDLVVGDVFRIQAGLIDLQSPEASVRIPLDRVSTMAFAGGPPADSRPPAWGIRTFFSRGGNLSFNLEQWTTNRVRGQSSIFGAIDVRQRDIQRVYFNLHRATESVGNLDITGDDIWEYHE